MRDIVRSVFRKFNEPYEGAIPYFYQDVRGLVSIGIGILTDPIELALHLPLLKFDGTPASQSEIIVEWHRIKDLPNDDKGRTPAQLGHRYARPHTTLHLDEAGIQSTLSAKLTQFGKQLVSTYPGFEEWPADAQLATLSMSWACGPGFGQAPPPSGFPKLAAALRALDFRTAALECHINEKPNAKQPLGNPGIVPRNKANKLLYVNAAIILEEKLDPAVLAWPIALADRISTPPEMPAVRPDRLEADPQPIVHDHSYPTGYDPADKTPTDPDDGDSS